MEPSCSFTLRWSRLLSVAPSAGAAINELRLVLLDLRETVGEASDHCRLWLGAYIPPGFGGETHHSNPIFAFQEQISAAP